MKPVESSRRREALFSAAAILFLLACEWFFFRQMYGSDSLFGDLGDGRLTNLIAEHWYHVFRGEASVGALGLFWPEANTLGYSDLLLGFGLIHSLFRFAGMNTYLAYKATLLLVHAFGTLSCFYLLRKVLNVRSFWALFGTAAFSFADTAVMALGHTQLAAVWMLPLFGIFGIRFLQHLHSRKKRNLYACAAVFQIVLVLYTAWYMAFFTALFVCTLCLVLWLILFHRHTAKKEIGAFFRTLGWDLAGYILFGAALVIPFVLLELPLLRSTGGFGYEEVLDALPRLTDLVHVTHTNWLLGGFFGSNPEMSGRSHEVIRGYSFVLWAVFAASLIPALRRLRRERKGKEIPAPQPAPVLGRTLLCAAAAAAVLLDLVLVLRRGSGFSLWRVIYEFFPGGKSIRAVGRFLLFLSLPLSVVTAVLADEWGRKMAARAKAPRGKMLSAAVCGLLLACLLVSNVNTSAPGYWTESAALARVGRVSAPPEDCEVMFLSHADPGEILPLQQTEAWEIADAAGVKTINGYSGQLPAGYGAVWLIDSEEYRNAVRAWVMKKDLHGVYEYNQEEDWWIPFD